jgi:UDP-hydrolysing UDP-N-acetyl-D-glucosamine 2-epimerase
MTIRVAYVTTNRSDYGPAHWLLRDLVDDSRFALQLVVGGAHLAAAHTVREIEDDGFTIAARVPFLDGDHAASSAAALTGFGAAFGTLQPDVVLLYGDRWELLPIANAALLAGVPIAHLCGGDVTEGALDNQVRHAVTKLAHVHFATSARSAKRILQMGEESWRVHDVGDPSLDRFRRGRAAGVDELTEALGFRPDQRTLLVTFHPPTLGVDSLRADVAALTSALRGHAGPIVITAPAPDPGADVVRSELEALARARPSTTFVESLGSDRYRGLMALVGAMVGNSSSGLSEAPCVPLPVVNIGDRQAGRDRARNVIDVPAEARAIGDAITRALAPEFRAGLHGLVSPYGDGRSAARIIDVLATLPDRARLMRKVFRDESATVEGPAPIGGDFPLDADWLFPADTAWLAAGRDAFAAIARTRPGRWLVPEFLCPIVPDTLRAVGAAVEPYSWLSPWEVDEDELAPRLAGAAGIIVPFHLGLPPTDAIWRAIDRGGGAASVVEDRCQCVGLPPRADTLRGDFAVGSLRKWMAVPDGAWCVARQGEAPRPSGNPAREMVQLRAAAGLTKATWLAEGAADSALERAMVELFARGEKAAGAGIARRSSGFVAHAVDQLDVAEVSRRRIENQRALAARLAASGSVELWQPGQDAFKTTPVPLLALPVLCRDRDALQQRLAASRIFCAVHWRDGDWSRSGGRAADWSARTLSLPIDQRLGRDDIDRVADAIEEKGREDAR